MNNFNQSKLWDTHICIITAFIFLSIVKIDVFGKVGLIGYGLLIIYTTICCIVNAKEKHFYYCLPFYAGIVYYATFLVVSFFNGSYTRIWSSLIQLFIIMLISFIYRSSDDLIKDIDSIARIMIISGTLMSSLSLVLSVITTFFPEILSGLPDNITAEIVRLSGNIHGRISGLTSNANQTAVYCLVGMELAIYLLCSTESIKWKILASINIILSLYTIFIATASRTSMLSTITFAAIFIPLYYFVVFREDKIRMKHFKFLLIGIICLVAIFIIVFIISAQTRSFILNDIIRIDSLKTGSNRTSVYKQAIEWGEGRRLIGFNINEYAHETGFHDTHNMFLEVLSTSGLLGLIFFLIYFGSSTVVIIKNLKNPLRKTNKERIIYCFFFAYIVSYFIWGMTESGRVNAIYHISLMVQIIFGYSSLFYQNNQKELKADTPSIT